MTATNTQTITLANARIALSVCVKATLNWYEPDWYELTNLIDDIENGYKSHLPVEHLHKVTLTSACRFWCEGGEPVTAQSFADDMTAILDVVTVPDLDTSTNFAHGDFMVESAKSHDEIVFDVMHHLAEYFYNYDVTIEDYNGKPCVWYTAQNLI